MIDQDGSTALHVAVTQRRLEILNRLLEFGAKVDCPAPTVGIIHSPYHIL